MQDESVVQDVNLVLNIVLFGNIDIRIKRFKTMEIQNRIDADYKAT